MEDHELERMVNQIWERADPSLARSDAPEEIAAAALDVTKIAENFLEAHQDAPEQSRIACGPGCSTCCVVNVAVLFPEAVSIASWVRAHFSPEEQQALVERLTALERDIRWLDDEDRILLRRPCAFLDESGSCTIHPVRPLLCRGVTSIDAQDCRAAITATAFGETRPVLMNLFQKIVMERAFQEFGEIVGRTGRDHGGLKLTVVLHQLLTEPGLVERWIAGEKIAAW